MNEPTISSTSRSITPAFRVVLGVCGSVAVYKSLVLVRLLRQAGCAVQVVMTAAATRFVTPLSFQAITGQRVLIDLWEGGETDLMEHIHLTRAATCLVVAPASANFMAKSALGLADDLLSATVAARTCPLLVAPAMNQAMWNNPAHQRNLCQLQADGVVILGPASGAQACGEEGQGRMLEPEELCQAILGFCRKSTAADRDGTVLPQQLQLQPDSSAIVPLDALALISAQGAGAVLALEDAKEEVQVLPDQSALPGSLQGCKVVLTAGPTFEPIDPVRGITNSSSGRMGYALAQAACEAGAEVVLISGPTPLREPPGCSCFRVQSAAEMLEATLSALPGALFFFAVAAVADYRPVVPRVQKMKKGQDRLVLELEPTQDILATVAALPNPPFCVGFAAESENLLYYGERKRRAKKVPLIVGNLAQRALGREDNEVILFDDAGSHPLPPASKIRLAQQILEHALKLARAQGKLGFQGEDITP